MARLDEKRVEEGKMKSFVIVVGIVKFKDKFLLLKRNAKSYNAANKWEFVSGYIKEFEPVEDCVLREVKEETGLDGKIIFQGEVLEVISEDKKWVTFPFLIEVKESKIKIDPKEHSEHTWIGLEEIKNFDCLNGVEKNLKSVKLL